jgi:DNA anti-recombination protein RmuC
MAEEFYDERKRFMEEMILRFEKAFRRVDESLSAHMRENTAALRTLTREIREHRSEFNEHLADSIEENRAGRQALVHILDELKGRGGSAAA